MKILQRRKKRRIEAAELDITPFMNLMIVLVPVLLLSMVFTHTTVIDLNFPNASALAKTDLDSVHLEVQVFENKLVVADQRGIIKVLPCLATGDHDYENLSLVLQELKRRVPKKRDILILLEAGTDYQTIVSTMDSSRSYLSWIDGELLPTELFPVLSLGDVPEGART